MASILIIDDDPGILKVLTRILETAGHSVSEASDGEAALRKYQGEPTDLVLTDIFMPGMDGIEFLLHCREAFPDAKILAMSGGGILPRDQILSDAAHLGADHILQKPFTSAEVLEAVGRALGEA